MNNDVAKLLNFIEETEKLKAVLRSGNTSLGRKESTAEHSWRLSLLTMLLSQYFQECDSQKLLYLAIIHDLGELDEGDIPAIENSNEESKFQLEENTIKRLVELLPAHMRTWFFDLWMEYEEGKTPEAIIVKSLDKIETIIQHNQVDNGEDFDYEFNLNYGKNIDISHPIIQELRDVVDEVTLKNVRKNSTGLCN